MLASYKVFHACSSKGGFEQVQKRAPFHSSSERTQWLTPGYYFWRSNKLAEQWGASSYSSGDGYAVLKATLRLSEDELFDLVANSEHIEYFEKLISQFMNFKLRTLGKKYTPTVSACLTYFREKAKVSPKILPYIAVMASETAQSKEGSSQKRYQFVSNRQNCIALNKRVQICLFTGNENRIHDRELIYPESWVA